VAPAPPVPSVTCAGGGAVCVSVAATPLEHAATVHATAATSILPARI
jgi:hypothetical protein